MNKYIWIFLALFFLGAPIGWVIEVFYRRFVSRKIWMNPGFLTGPWLPLYGFGLSWVYCIVELFSLFKSSMPLWAWYIVTILSMGIAMTLIEFVAGVIFIKGFKTALWDYSNKKGNIMGIICPQYSLIWLGASAIYIFAHPFFRAYADLVVSNQLSIFPLGFLSGAFVVDFGYSAHVLIRIRAFINDRRQTIDWDQIKINLKNGRDKVRDSLFKVFFWPFSIGKENAESSITKYLFSIKKLAKPKDIDVKDEEK